VAMPEAFVTEAGAELVAPPVPAQLTVTPLTGLAPTSLTRTLRGVTSVAPIVSVWALPAFKAIVVAPPLIAVAVNPTGEPASPGTVAVAVWVPAALPSTRVADAMPLPLVAELGVIDPPPATAQVTVTPLTGLPARSLTSTVYALASVAPIVSVWVLPPARAMVVALPCVAVAVKVTGEPVSPPTDAVAVWTAAPAVVPRIRVATATPLPLVVDEAVIDPPPPVTAQATGTPPTGLL